VRDAWIRHLFSPSDFVMWTFLVARLCGSLSYQWVVVQIVLGGWALTRAHTWGQNARW
jgi:hypothetical protein